MMSWGTAAIFFCRHRGPLGFVTDFTLERLPWSFALEAALEKLVTKNPHHISTTLFEISTTVVDCKMKLVICGDLVISYNY